MTEILKDKAETETISNEDVLSPMSLICFTADKMNVNGRKGKWIGCPIVMDEGSEIPPFTDAGGGNAPHRRQKCECKMMDGKNGVRMLGIVGAEILPRTEGTSQTYGDGGQNESLTGG
jgi:hypothetical protein